MASSRRIFRSPALAAGLLVLASGLARGQTPTPPPDRPIPYPVRPSPQFLAAVEAGSRTLEGRPGPAYWQQSARYEIDARVDPEAKRVEGTTRIVYRNRSPRPLAVLRLRLIQNYHAEGAPRHQEAEVTGGYAIGRIALNGSEVSDTASRPPRAETRSTILRVWMARPVAPGDSVTLDLAWSYTIPKAGAGGRMGWDGDDLIYLAYWFPQMAVFDDVVGWQEDPFLGRAEFYADFADYEVRITVPGGWVVTGTGELVNAEETLAPPVLERLRRAEESDEVVHVLTAEDFGPGRATRVPADGGLTWLHRATKVRDVAYALTRASLWDAARTPVGDRDGDGATDFARVDALYRASSPNWATAAGHAQHAIRTLSEYLDYPYPWPHMTAVEGSGIIGGGMEYPMMTLIGSFLGMPDAVLYSVIAHEFGHMWLPMIVNSDEIRWAWMDEGTTSFNTAVAAADRYPGTDPEANEVMQYAGVAKAGFDGTMMRWTDWEYPTAWGVAAYPKPSAAMVALREVIGEDAFLGGYRGYIRAWAFRHPKPEDFFHTFEAAAGRDLDWFWRGWFYEQWTMDHAVASVTPDGDGTRIVIEDRGDLPMPARIEVERADGTRERLEAPVERWLAGARTAEVRAGPGAAVVAVRLDPGQRFPDTDRGNDVWEAGAGG
ncbi:MAG: M1 family metallopeptidase [Gemmatimonadota bacterium]